mmetsp:Transcript_67347/g.170871  ORF Transcript_67347/g.170871 Transcript_67347/m.170871 type:complete len:282 (+) Transcript_67347:212-1057(+)
MQTGTPPAVHRARALGLLRVDVLGVADLRLPTVEQLFDLGAGERQPELWEVHRVDGIGELDVQDQEQGPEDEGALVRRHALVRECLQARALGQRLDDLPRLRLRDELPAVEVRDQPPEAGQRLEEVDLAREEEIRALPSEVRVLLLVHDHNEVACVAVGLLIGLANEDEFLPMLHTLLHKDLQDLAQLLRPHHGADPGTHRARARQRLQCRAVAHNLPRASALGTGPRLRCGGAILAPIQHLPVDGELPGAACVELLQSHLQWVHNVLCPSPHPTRPLAAA